MMATTTKKSLNVSYVCTLLAERIMLLSMLTTCHDFTWALTHVHKLQIPKKGGRHDRYKQREEKIIEKENRSSVAKKLLELASSEIRDDGDTELCNKKCKDYEGCSKSFANAWLP